MENIKEIPDINVFENWVDPEPDPDAYKYRVNGYEDFLTPRTIVNPRYQSLYEPETEPQFTNDNAALEDLIRKEPSQLLQPEKKRLVVLLRAQGWSINEICRKIEMSKPTVIKAIRKFSSEISQLKRTELEELLQCYSLTLKKRIQTFGGGVLDILTISYSPNPDLFHSLTFLLHN